MMEHNLTLNQITQLLNKIGEIQIKYSDYTEKYYVVLTNFSFIRNYRWQAVKDIISHEKTPEQAIISFFNELIDSDDIVINFNSLDRFDTAKNVKILKFINNDFVNITDEIFKDYNREYFLNNVTYKSK